jgi:hypothetical protein
MDLDTITEGLVPGRGLSEAHARHDYDRATEYAHPGVVVPPGATHQIRRGYRIPPTGRPTIDSRGGSQGDPFNQGGNFAQGIRDAEEAGDGDPDIMRRGA